VIFAENSRGEEFQRIQLGVTFSPAYSYRTLKGDRENWALKLRNEDEIAKFGYSGGLNICFNRNSLFGIESGILYTNMGYRTKKRNLNFGDDVPDHELTIRHVYSYHYIDVPLKARLSTEWQKKVRFSTGIGVITGFLVGFTNTLQIENEKNQTSPLLTENHNRVNLSPIISAGVDYMITSKSFLRVEPVFQYGLVNTIKSEAPISQYLWSMGVNVSYLIGIK